jgi:uncharacterized protein
VRAVVDPNVLISALLSPIGRPAQVLVAWREGGFELVACPQLLDELRRALTYPRLRKRIPPADADAFVDWLERTATLADHPRLPPPIGSSDPGDDYLIALAAQERTMLVSGDRHLLDLQAKLPIVSAKEFLSELEPA